MSPAGFVSNVKVHAHAKRPAFLRRWVFVTLRALGWTLPLGFLVRVEVEP